MTPSWHTQFYLNVTIWYFECEMWSCLLYWFTSCRNIKGNHAGHYMLREYDACSIAILCMNNFLMIKIIKKWIAGTMPTSTSDSTAWYPAYPIKDAHVLFWFVLLWVYCIHTWIHVTYLSIRYPHIIHGMYCTCNFPTSRIPGLASITQGSHGYRPFVGILPDT